MLESPHVAVGAAIATKIPNPFIALPLALASHFVMDRVPHWNPHFYTETQKYGKPKKGSTYLAFADIGFALVLGSGVAYMALPNIGHAITILIASFFSVLPDLTKTPFYFLKNRGNMLKKYVDFERSIQIETGFAVGSLVQILVIVTSLLWALS
jgi:hypothetical protein